jgi:Asp-tRNA(Asn)/Glu-tRNA(Gln) amidotransferase A subunit family amidase
MGSSLWKGYTPGNDARVVFNLKYEGGMVAGKTVTAEFAVHEPGPTRNPHDLRYYPGTSSSGSTVAVACGMVPVALGTQTAGSIVRPASYCGVYGFKPTFGLIPRTGVLKTTDTLDQIGWFARNIADIELLFDVLRVRGQNYPYVYNLIDRKPDSFFTRKKWRLVLLEHPKWEFAETYAKKAIGSFVDRLERSKKIEVVTKKLPIDFDMAHDVHDTIYNKTLAYYFKEEHKQKQLVSPVLSNLIEKGNGITPHQYLEALEKQVYLRESLNSFIKRSGDLFITLSTSGEASLFESPEDKPDSCLIWSLCGSPALSVPIFKGPNKLPFGLQVVALPYFDKLIFNFVKELQLLKYVNAVSPVTPKESR